ncbi:pyruvate:ferredoxin (flavodoxin) oxidoreductase [Acidipropionibacterium jensenii]|uniref:pyruvate:ferredoxin (flavodoxin) oxidoreductase n=1 Tax=Acidipropionibacterium jensenii TaxID=1749 RepID=UPI000BC2F6A6|nr:pyruvate:ferredoxin (flavodoxin) oxidoreductase [Acidipropionibacterium jensenii]AZZ41318.1 pyruvate:ferredoxin (flavodoxin) oxidoreductase [Acidipropionibacterium jensenii]
MERTRTIADGNTAAASVAYRCSELCSIYPITPSSPMAETADEWSSAKRVNIWGDIPTVMEMQSEGGAAGALHGALQGGALTTTFTASQGLLLMIPNMYKIAGELTSTVFHVAARSLAAQGLSIFGDHQDVMACRQTGFAMLCSATVQECHDLALISHAATMQSRVPFMHFFEGFRTSHELNVLETLSDDDIRQFITDDLVHAHRERALSPAHPFIRGTAQNPDIHFQAREAANQYYEKVPGIVQGLFDQFAELTGRSYHLVDYFGDPQAEQVIVCMGSGAKTVQHTIEHLNKEGHKLGVVMVRLFRPFPAAELVRAIPETARTVAVLDRTKEPGSEGEPLFLDVVSALSEAVSRGRRKAMPIVSGGRYGISSKEFTPGMVSGIVDELELDQPRPRFTIGIDDDVTHLSLPWQDLDIEDPKTLRAVFFGMGSDGTVGANKNTIKILGSDPDTFAQGYFEYDSRKSGSRTTSHLRFGPNPIESAYLVNQAEFIGVHNFNILESIDVLTMAHEGTTVLINAPYDASELWDHLPDSMQRQIIDKKINLWTIDALPVARKVGLRNRTNTILQTCFFAISGVLPRDEAIKRIKDSIQKTYGKKSQKIVEMNHAAVDASLEHLHQVTVPGQVTSKHGLIPPVTADAPEFVRDVTARMIEGQGNLLPVSAVPDDGTYPAGTTKFEQRTLSDLIAEWDPQECIQCGNCAFVCPHGVIRSKYYPQSSLEGAPAGFPTATLNAAGLPESNYTLQVVPDQCTGCGLCVEACPVRPAAHPDRRAINLAEHLDKTKQRRDLEFFETLPVNDRSRVDFASVRGTQFLQPLFEFSGACSGCGETPYVKLVSQLFGDRAEIANATGCSSIYGGNLPTTPWGKNADGRGPAWSNSLFEDNAEFGLGMRLAADVQTNLAKVRLGQLAEGLDAELVDGLLNAPQLTEHDLQSQQERVHTLQAILADMEQTPQVRDLISVADHLLRRSVWIIGGDGWAYDIGSSGVDHVLASGRDVNVLVLDTEVYSNTGGQASKSTPMGAVAKFATSGKPTSKKDLAMQAIAYGSVYVARVALGADPQQTLRAFREAEAYPGPSIIIAYSHCIAHGYDLKNGLDQQYKAVHCGHWPLMRYNPVLTEEGLNPFLLDSPRPDISWREYTKLELRYKMLNKTNPEAAERFLDLDQRTVERRWTEYEDMATRSADRFSFDARTSEFAAGSNRS